MSQKTEVKVGDRIRTLIAVREEGEFNFEKGELFTIFEIFHESLPGCVRITDFDDEEEDVWLESHEYELVSMSQERTEQRDPAKDREIIAAATPGPWRHQNCLVVGRGTFSGQVIADCGYYKPIDEANAIYIAESRESWPAALDEIDRLKAVIRDKDESGDRMLSAKDKIIRDLTAKVRDRDAEIIRQRERGDRLDSELHKQNCRNQDQAEGIERLRAEIDRLEALVEKQVDIISGHDEGMRLAKWMHERDTREIERLRAALAPLKGAE